MQGRLIYVADYGEIGDNEWLWFFVTGNGGSEPVYSVKSVTKTVRNTARAIVTVLQRWEDGTETDAKECEVLLKRIYGQIFIGIRIYWEG